MTSPLQLAAAAAVQQRRTQLTASALTTLRGFLVDEALADELTVAAVDVASGLVVFTDSSLYLAVQPDGTVFLVEQTDPDHWTQKVGPLADLVALGLAQP